MKNTNKAFLRDLASRFPDIEKIPQIQNIVDRVLDDATLAVMEAEFDADMEATGELIIDDGVEDLESAMPSASTAPSPAPAPCRTGTQHISIRIPVAVLTACKMQAHKRCLGYQTLINRILKQATSEWA